MSQFSLEQRIIALETQVNADHDRVKALEAQAASDRKRIKQAEYKLRTSWAVAVFATGVTFTGTWNPDAIARRYEVTYSKPATQGTAPQTKTFITPCVLKSNSTVATFSHDNK